MASDDEDDYLSDKFLFADTTPSSSKPATYSDKRREALRKAQLKNEQNRKKSRRELELESREEGLSKSLFERAAEQAPAGDGGAPGNKALAMMMKMGFKPGQTLGRTEDDKAEDGKEEQDVDSSRSPDTPAIRSPSGTPAAAEPTDGRDSVGPPSSDSRARSHRHRAEPLPLNEWTGASPARFPPSPYLPSFFSINTFTRPCIIRPQGYRSRETGSIADGTGETCQDGEVGGGDKQGVVQGSG